MLPSPSSLQPNGGSAACLLATNFSTPAPPAFGKPDAIWRRLRSKRRPPPMQYFWAPSGFPACVTRMARRSHPHLRLRERLQLYAGVRPIKAYPNAPRRLADERAAHIDLVILRESTEGLFYSAAVHHRSQIIGDHEVRETLRITRSTTEKLHDFAFRLAERRKACGGKGRVTCVDKANVFHSMAFFRKIFDERAARFPGVERSYNYVDAQALDLIRRPWDFDVLVMENMFGDILSDLAGGLVGGMGMAACAEIGDAHGLFQPAHGSAPDIHGPGQGEPAGGDSERRADARLSGRALRTGGARERGAHDRNGDPEWLRSQAASPSGVRR